MENVASNIERECLDVLLWVKLGYCVIKTKELYQSNLGTQAAEIYEGTLSKYLRSC